jgi:hypothetical protein
MIFSQLVLHFGQAGRQDVDGNLTGHFFFIDAAGLPTARGRSFLRPWREPYPALHTSTTTYKTVSTPRVLLVADPVNLLRHRPIMLREPLQTRDALLISVDHLSLGMQPLGGPDCG